MPMRFRNFGGIYQFLIADEEDLARIDALDPARWAATSAPIEDLHCDAVFLKHVDAEGTGRVRVGQIVRARDWAFERLARRSVLKGRHESIALDALDAGALGEPLRAAAKRVNKEQKAADEKSISLADVRGFKGSYQKLLANGDGVVPPEVVPEADVAAFLKDVIATVGSVKDRGGSDGVDAALLDRFKTQGQAWLDWRAKARDAAVWGDATSSAAALVAKLSPKIDAYFLHADLLRQEAPTSAVQKLTDDEFRAMRVRDAAAIEAYLLASPIAAPDASGVLSLDAATALYRDDVTALRDTVLARALGAPTKELTRASWRTVKAVFEAFEAWQKAKPAEPFDALGEDKVKAHLAGPLPARVTHFIELDLAAAAELTQIDALERLLLSVRWLIDLANNFVNFSAIYLPQETALVEMGTLVIDGRRLAFCVKVADRAAHKPLASESLIFLVYAKITDKAGGQSFEVVAPVTGGEKGRLRVGKRGIFIDNEGAEWDSEVVEVVENPISVREAMFSPFRRAAKFVNDKVESWVGSAATAQEEGLQSSTAAATDNAQQEAEAAAARAAAASAAPPAAPAREGLNVNTLILGGGIALAGVGAVLASVFSLLSTLKGWLAIVGIVGAVLAFSALNAWLKLRRRDMSVLLEANGWAVNVHTRITKRIAQVFAFTPELPKDAKLEHADMLPGVDEDGNVGWPILVLLLVGAGVTLAWYGRFRGHWF
jgi:hypothetical protein